MEFGKGLLVLLLVLVMFSDAELDDENSKNREDVGQKSNTGETDNEEEIADDDLETAFEQLREIRALRDTIFKLVPASNPFLRDSSIGKQRKGDSHNNEDEDDVDEEDDEDVISKEAALDADATNSWMKAVIAHTKEFKASEENERSLSDGIAAEFWAENEETVADIQDEEIVEPLTPEQQEGSVI